MLLPLIILLFFVDNLPGDTESNIRYYGYMLEVTGTLAIAYGLKGKLVEFKGHGFSVQFWEHLKSFPLRKIKQNYTIYSNLSSPSQIVSGLAKVTNRPKDDNVNEMIKYLEGEIEYLKRTIDKLRTETKEDFAKLENNLSNVKNTIGTEIMQMKRQVENSAISNIWLEFFGLCCLLIGVTLGTIPDVLLKVV